MNKPAERASLKVEVEKWPLKAPFRITGYTFNALDVVAVTLEQAGHIGRGEAAGVYYLNDDVQHIVQQVESVRPHMEAGVNRAALQRLLPAGGARNALDCALWDLDAKRSGQAAWQIAGLEAPKPLLSTFTVSANDAQKMAEGARGYSQARALKLKLTGESEDLDRVRAVRAARPDVWLGVDANQGFTRAFLEQVMPVFLECGVQLIEQPFRVGREADLDGFKSPIPIAADESVQSSRDVAALVGRFDVINIKLDKCGGLTEGLAMAAETRKRGMDVMVGNMTGTSLAMAPAFLVGQLCKVVDLDGPIFLREDRARRLRYERGNVWCPEELWGGTASRARQAQ